MNNASLYSTANNMQKRDANYILEKYFDYIEWSQNGGDISLDIGCGSGDVTAQILMKKVPNNIGYIIGTDVSKTMIDYATITHANTKLKFQQLDIQTEYLPNHLIDRFDHVFSFYCFHWIQNQRQAYENIYKLLKSKGDLLITFLPSNPLYSTYETIANIPKWKPFMMDVTKYASPFQHSKHPERELKKIVEDAGFKVHFCKCESRCFIFDNCSEWRKSIQAVNPFIDRIPEKMRGEYINEYVNLVKKLNSIEENNNKVYFFNTVYNLLTIYATKKC